MPSAPERGERALQGEHLPQVGADVLAAAALVGERRKRRFAKSSPAATPHRCMIAARSCLWRSVALLILRTFSVRATLLSRKAEVISAAWFGTTRK